MNNKRMANFRFSEDSIQCLAELAEHLGINKTAVLEMVLREKFRNEGLTLEKTVNEELSEALNK